MNTTTWFTDPLMVVFGLVLLGSFLGNVKLRGVTLGTSGVLLVAMVFGHFGFDVPQVLGDLGLSIFVTTVGLRAGPGLLSAMRRQGLKFAALGAIIVFTAFCTTVVVSRLFQIPLPLSVGLMTGALTSTPGLAAGLEAANDPLVAVGYGIAYPFGVVAVVLFVQLFPRLLRIDLVQEASASQHADIELPGGESSSVLLSISAIALTGAFLGRVPLPIPGVGTITLGMAGGPLLVAAAMGHLGQVGPIGGRFSPDSTKLVQDLGLSLFLARAGTSAGNRLLEVLSQEGPVLVLAGALITLTPMMLAMALAQKCFQLSTLQALGSICGGMTSTPGLGALSELVDAREPTTAYSGAYPIALILVAVAAQILDRVL